jgi:hypothetical protein
MWAGGITICTYLFFSSDNSAQPINAPVISIAKNLNAANSLQDNDAYVFINVNEKHFLTRFIAAVPPEEVKTVAKRSDNQPPVTVTVSVERVSRKTQPAPANNVAEFAIKPVPRS